MRKLICLLSGLILAGQAAGGPAPTEEAARGDVVLTAVGARAEQGGSLVFSLFRGRDGWPKAERAIATQAVPADAESVTVVFAAVPRDTIYAALVVHDKNGNGKLDMRTLPFPKPKEGAGVSNNHRRKGPPDYEKARFALADSAVALRITLHY